jgi:queuine tRNA-ribosyltransferase
VKLTVHRVATGSRARRATLTTLHGEVATPVFMPVGTRASVRTQSLDQLEALGAPILLANTYHLMVRPGRELFTRMGGLHRWMGWTRPILTDSGGYQIFSLRGARSLGDAGAELRSHHDGVRILLTPERSIEMQRAIGSDIMMVLDECVPSTCARDEARAAMERTHRWALRSLAARGDSPQALFAIVQGACDPDLRRESAAALTAIPGFDGYAIGGLAVGEGRAQREDVTELTAALLPADRPRYLMGVGTPLDLLEAVHRGVDMFDCVLPTAWAQQGVAFTSHGKIDLRRGVHRDAERPLDGACPCPGCARYSRSYLHHLVKCKEPLGWQLLAHHNLRFYLTLMAEIREHIAADTFAALYAARREALARVDPDHPPRPAPAPRPRRPLARGAFALRASPAGFTSVVHVASGEVMHSVSHPDEEADRVYVAQSAILAEVLAGARPAVVWDVGLGAGHNAMALVRRLDAAPGHGAVHLISFERDLDGLRLALEHGKALPHLRHPGPHRLAARGAFHRPSLVWELRAGDFLDEMARAPAPDVVFYDPFSAKVDGPLWTLAALERLARHLIRPAEVLTYSRSTAVRSALLAAGLYVARGVPSGPKEETTIAIALGGATAISECPALARHSLLDGAWLARRARSAAPLGADVPADRRAEIEARLRDHPQFARAPAATAP